MSEINYDDKVDLVVDTGIDDIFKVTASDMNQIKNAVNDNATNIATLETDKLDKESVVNEPSTETDEVYSSDYLNDKLVSVGTTAPTDGRRVWFEKGKNLINYEDFTGTIKDYYFVSLPSTHFGLKAGKTYTLSLDIVSSATPFAISVGAGTTGYAVDIKQNSNYQNGRSSITFTPTETQLANGNILFFRAPRYTTSQSSVSFTIKNVQLEEGSTTTTFEQYKEPSINVDDEQWYIKPRVLWSGRETSVNIDLTGYSFIEVIFCSNDNFYNSLKVPVSGSTFSRSLALCNSYLSDPMNSSGHLYLRYGKATLTQSGITIKANVEVDITNTASQIKWQGATNTLLYITTIIGYK